MKSGNYQQCYKGKKLGNIYDLDSPVKFLAIGHHCREGHCFNGHAFLGFGLIPGLDTIDFADMRNRKMPDGKNWLSPEMNYFMRHKLSESNEVLTEKDKIISDIKSISVKQIMKQIIGKR